MPNPTLYTWDVTGELTVPGAKPTGSTGLWLFPRRPDGLFDPTRMGDADYAPLWRAVRAAGGIHCIDEYALRPGGDPNEDVSAWADAWLTAVTTCRDAYRKWRGDRRAAYSPLVYNFPPAPYAVSTLPEKNWVYGRWRSNYVTVLHHPLARAVGGLAPSMYRDYRGQPYAEWAARSDAQLADLRWMHRGTGVRLVAAISGVAAAQPDGRIVAEPAAVSGESVTWSRARRVPAVWWWPAGDVPAGVTAAHVRAVGAATAGRG